MSFLLKYIAASSHMGSNTHQYILLKVSHSLSLSLVSPSCVMKTSDTVFVLLWLTNIVYAWVVLSVSLEHCDRFFVVVFFLIIKSIFLFMICIPFENNLALSESSFSLWACHGNISASWADTFSLLLLNMYHAYCNIHKCKQSSICYWTFRKCHVSGWDGHVALKTRPK